MGETQLAHPSRSWVKAPRRDRATQKDRRPAEEGEWWGRSEGDVHQDAQPSEADRYRIIQIIRRTTNDTTRPWERSQSWRTPSIYSDRRRPCTKTTWSHLKATYKRLTTKSTRLCKTSSPVKIPAKWARTWCWVSRWKMKKIKLTITEDSQNWTRN